MESLQTIFKKLNLDILDGENQGWVFIVPIILKLQSEGATVFIKTDGGREKNIFTIMIEGGALENDYIRCETSNLEEGISKVISEYSEMFWS
ncbi:MAG: hypothetical protein L3J75_12190 [Methylococcaceae bacterium]|nr:hypothetical protein [Methylococcaceae bacterium]